LQKARTGYIEDHHDDGFAVGLGQQQRLGMRRGQRVSVTYFDGHRTAKRAHNGEKQRTLAKTQIAATSTPQTTTDIHGHW
jgi:hypothetical protein